MIYRLQAWFLGLLVGPDVIACTGCGKALIGDRGVIACGKGVEWTCGSCCEQEPKDPHQSGER